MTDSPNLDLVRLLYADWERGDFFGGPGEWIDPRTSTSPPTAPTLGGGRAGRV